MQITFVRHGEYDKDSGALTDAGIEQMTRSAMVLKDVSDKQKGIFREEPFHPDPNDPSIIVPKLTYSDYLTVWGEMMGGRNIHIKSETDPDLIITSSMTRAMQSGFVMQRQLKEMGINTELEAGIPYFDELKTDDINFGGHGYISQEQLPKLCKQESIQNALKYLKKLEMDGHKHIVVLTHQPNIQALGYAICGNPHILPPQNGDLMAIYSEAGLNDRKRLLFNHCRVNIDISGGGRWKNEVIDMAKRTFHPLTLEKIKEELQKFSPQIDDLRGNACSRLETIKGDLDQIKTEDLKKELRSKVAAKRIKIKEADPDRKKVHGMLKILRTFSPSQNRKVARKAATELLKKEHLYS